MFLARMVSAQKWRTHENIHEGEISADAVTTDLRTANNILSFWTHDPTNEKSLEDIAVALAANRSKVQRLDIVWLDEDAVKGVNLRIDPTPGETPFHELNDSHRDVVGLDLSRLGRLSELIASAIKGNRAIRYSEKQILTLLQQAVKAKRIEITSLPDGIIDRINSSAA